MATRRKRNLGRNPFRGIADTVSEMNRIADRMTSPEGVSVGPQQARSYSDVWVPATDILAKRSDVIIRCEVPGVKPDEVEVSLSRGTLTIAGSRATSEDDQEEDYLVRERSYGHFRRDITLPEGVQEEDIEASFREGLLEITVRGSAYASGPSRIAIRTPD